MNNKSVGFIILRNIMEEKDNIKWMTCYSSIRRFYPSHKIVIIDDSANKLFVNVLFEKTLSNTVVIESDYAGAGEILPYYYFYQQRYFDIAVIIPDSLYMCKYIDFTHVSEVHTFWDFGHQYDNDDNILYLLSHLNKNEELKYIFERKEMWKGCFKGICVISHVFLSLLEERYKFSSLVDVVNDGSSREALERVLAIIFAAYRDSVNCFDENVIFGDVFLSHPWVNQLCNINTIFKMSAIIADYYDTKSLPAHLNNSFLL